MRTVLIGAVEGSAVALRAMMDAGMPPAEGADVVELSAEGPVTR